MLGHGPQRSPVLTWSPRSAVLVSVSEAAVCPSLYNQTLMIEAKRCTDAGSQSRKEQATLSTLIGRTMGRTPQRNITIVGPNLWRRVMRLMRSFAVKSYMDLKSKETPITGT